MIYYTKDHEWIEIDGDTGTVGISPHAKEQLGDIVFIELPEDNTNVSQGDSIAVFESVKAASDIYSPVTGTIIEVNTPLADDLSSITADTSKQSWLFKIRLSDTSELDSLMDETAYNTLIAE